MENKFLGSSGLARFLEKLYGVFSEVGHTHSKKDITDFPTIPTKTSELTNDSGFKTTDNNTTYTLTKVGSAITLSGSDGSSVSVTDDDTKITVDTDLSEESVNPVQNKTIKLQFDNVKDMIDGISTFVAQPEAPSDTSLLWLDTDDNSSDGLSGSGGGTGSVMGGSDWNASEGEPGHVLNRTHWVEGGIVEIVPETTLTTTEDYPGEFSVPDGVLVIEAGKTYIVTYNGTEYTCVAVDGGILEPEMVGQGVGVIGNYAMALGMGNTGEPFIALYVPDNGTMVMDMNGAMSITVAVSCNDVTVHKLPMEFLPEGYPCVETAMEPPTFDGDLSGWETIFLGSNYNNAYVVRIAAQSLTVEELIGATVVLNMNGEEQSLTITSEMAVDSASVFGVEGSVVLQGTDSVVMSLKEDSTIQGISFRAGTWFACVPGYFYVKSLSCLTPINVKKIRKMDMKYMPDGYPYVETITLAPTFNGNPTGREIVQINDGMYFVKTSPQYVPEEDLKGSLVTIVAGNEEGSESISSEMIIDMSSIWGVTGSYVYADGTPLIITIQDDFSVEGLSLTAGTWFLYITEGVYVKSLSCLQPGEVEVIHKLDDKFLPDHLPRIDTIVVNDPTFNGDMVGKEKVLADSATGAYAVKITPQIVSIDELVGETITIYTNNTEESGTITSDMVVDATSLLGVSGAVVLQGESPIVLSLPEDSTIQGARFSAGTWFMCIPDTFYVVSLSCLQSGSFEVIHKLDKKFLSNVQPDMSVNDSDSDSYIKNRTHWTDNDGTVHKLDNKYINSEWLAVREPMAVEIVPETTFDIKSTTNINTATVLIDDEIVKQIVVGQTAYVTVDGTSYTFEVKAGGRYGTSTGRRWFGNGSLLSISNTGTTVDTGEPILFFINSSTWTKIVIFAKDAPAEHTISVTINGILSPVTIPVEFLPTDINFGSSLPEVTTENNNQILKVVDGVWTNSTQDYNDLINKPIPEVTTSDDGAFLRVVNGKWAAVTIPNVRDGEF